MAGRSVHIEKHTVSAPTKPMDTVAAARKTFTSSWPGRLDADLSASDQLAANLFAGMSEERLNWQPAPGSWSAGQCIEHLCITNEAYLPAISAALIEKPDSPVREITPGWFGRWFLRSFIEPSPQTKRAPAPPKTRPASRIELSVLERFLAGNQACREVILRAREKNVNDIRFWNPLLPGVRFTVGTGLEIIAAHERRHLLQAQRVHASANFPR